MAEERKKRLLNKWEIFFLIVAIIILLGVFLQQVGVPIIYKSEDTEIIEDPHPGY